MTADGSATVYGARDAPLVGLIFTHIEGDLAWDVILDAAVAGDWVIVPIGGPVCIVTEEQADQVPDELKAAGLVHVRTATQLRLAATGSGA